MLTIKQIYSSRLFGNIWNQFFLYGFSHIVPIVLIPFLINTVGIEKYGLINFALAFSFYFQLVNEFGFDLSNVRHVVNNRENKRELSRILSSILTCKLLLVVGTLCVYALVVFSVERFREYTLLYSLAFVRLIGIVIAPFWLFQSMEDIKYVTRVTIPVKILCMAPVFLIVRSEDDFVWVMFCYALECIVSGVVALLLVLKRYQLSLLRVSWQDIKFFFKDSWLFFTSTALMYFYKNSNTVVLGFCGGDALVGIYTAAEKLHNAYSSFVAPILNKVFYPYFTRVKNFVLINKIVLSLVCGNLLLLAVVYFISPWLIEIFIHESSDEIIYYFRMFLVLLSISIPVDMLGFPYLGVKGRVKNVVQSTVWTVVVYIVGIFVLLLWGKVSIAALIFLLIVSNVFCLGYRLYCIHHK